MQASRAPAAVLATLLLGFALVAAPRIVPDASDGEAITGPYALLLGSSQDLGPSRADDVQLTVTLPAAERPEGLIEWAADRDLQVRWQPGNAWAIVAGPAEHVSAAFDVPVHDFKGRQGQHFYASPVQPALPPGLAGDVTEVGRILSYLPGRTKLPDLPRDVPRPGLNPADLLAAYNAKPLWEAGYTGQGQTVVIFGFGGFDQTDLDMYSDTMGLPRIVPEVVGGPFGATSGETVMDLQVVHAVAPDARLVVVNARPTVEGGGTFEKIGRLFDEVAQQHPNSVWSLSIGWGCDALVSAADVAPVRAALARAHRRGISVFNASGDNAGLECKGGKDWSAPPGPDQVGLDTIASLPEITSVGGTTLSTDMRGRWMQEWGWTDPVLSQGSSGGVSRLFDRPDYQRALPAYRDGQRRLVPDIAAVADPFTGMQIVIDQKLVIGGGTSQAAPIWAGLTTLMNQYIVDKGGRPLADINPLLYRVSQGSKLPGFRDITAGGNAVDFPGQGYDLVTGLGSPNVANLVGALFDAQQARSQSFDYLSGGG